MSNKKECRSLLCFYHASHDHLKNTWEWSYNTSVVIITELLILSHWLSLLLHKTFFWRMEYYCYSQNTFILLNLIIVSVSGDSFTNGRIWDVNCSHADRGWILPDSKLIRWMSERGTWDWSLAWQIDLQITVMLTSKLTDYLLNQMNWS